MFKAFRRDPSMIRCPAAVCLQTARGWSRPWACRASPKAGYRGSAKIEPFSAIGPRTMARDGKVKAFLDRPIEGDWPYLWIDATYLKVRRGGRAAIVARTNGATMACCPSPSSSRWASTPMVAARFWEWIQALPRPSRSGPSFCAN